MKPKQLFVRCFAEKRNGQWQAICLDFDLAAQGNSFEDAKHKLESQMYEYVYDALAGEDQAYAHQLLTRRAPYYLWLRYYWYSLLIKVLNIQIASRRFKEKMPLVPDGSHSFA